MILQRRIKTSYSGARGVARGKGLCKETVGDGSEAGRTDGSPTLGNHMLLPYM